MKDIIVVGSSNTDMIIRVPKLPNPGETLLGGEFSTAGGGKGANQAIAAARCDGRVAFVGCLGRDDMGNRALDSLVAAGINTRFCIRDSNAPSGVAQILVADDGENCIAVAPGANACLRPAHIVMASDLFKDGAIVLVQLETPLDTVLSVLEHARQGGCTALLNPAPAQTLPETFYPLLDYITPNESETKALTGIDVVDAESAARAADVLHSRGVGAVLITRGSRGVFLSTAQGDASPRREGFHAFEVTAVDTTAAGDVFNGCFAVALAEGKTPEEAIPFAQAAAALSVQMPGAQSSLPSRLAVDRLCAVTR